MRVLIPTRVQPAVVPAELTPRQVAREFAQNVREGLEIAVAGSARRDPAQLLRGYQPKHKLELFDVALYLTNLRFDAHLGFFVAYVVPGDGCAYPRIFYKDVSLVWRSATHVIRSDSENWIGKGALKTAVQDGEKVEYGAEETTDLPLEIQSALDTLSRRGPVARRDNRAVAMVLRNAPDDRIEPYRDFDEPRRLAHADPRNLINKGRDVARFTRANDPRSLRFARGFAPDFAEGFLELSRSRSRMYGGAVRKHRYLSENRRIQYMFIKSPRQVWILPPQALTTQIMSYGLRTIDANAPDDLCVPAYEYHFIDQHAHPPVLHSQIPSGFAGRPSRVDPTRADASSWIEKLPVVEAFRRAIARRRTR